MELTETIKPYVNELDPDKVRVYRVCSDENEHIYLVVSDEDQLEGSLEGLR